MKMKKKKEKKAAKENNKKKVFLCLGKGKNKFLFHFLFSCYSVFFAQ